MESPVSVQLCLQLVFWIIHLKVVQGGIHKSQISDIDCKEIQETTFQKTVADSFLLTEGESLLMDCGVCKHCSQLSEECTRKTDFQSWTTQGSRYGRARSELGDKFADGRFDFQGIRRRLHERLWHGTDYYPPEVDSMLRWEVYEDDMSFPMNFTSNKFHSPQVIPQLDLYILRAREGEKDEVLRPTGLDQKNARIQLSADTIFIKQTQIEDTAVYSCYWNGKRLKEWAITVATTLDEPFRHVILPTDYDALALQQLEAEISAKNITMESYQIEEDWKPEFLPPEILPENNLRVFTEWLPWSDCVPCTVMDQLPHSPEPGGDGFQMRIGICRVQILDLFYSIRPHSLALQIDETLRTYTKRGLPCRSHLIKEALALYGPNVFRTRPSEIQHRKCVRTCPLTGTSQQPNVYRYPVRLKIRVNEGEKLVLQCPIRGPVQGPVTWYFSRMNEEALVNLTNTALSGSTIAEYGSPSRFLMNKMRRIHPYLLFKSTRGRIRLDPAYHMVFTETMYDLRHGIREYARLFCIHGDPRSTREIGYSDWAGIIEVDTMPHWPLVILLGKCTQMLLLLIPFLMACGTFLIVINTIRTERKPEMRAAAEGYTNNTPL